jgi:phenylacetate-CoA ligase
VVSSDRYLEPDIETMAPAELRDHQEQRVIELVSYAYERSAFYRELWDAHGVHPRDIRSLADFQARIPFMDKDMLRAYRARTGDPYGGVLCAAPDELTSVTSSSGTTGDPEFFAEIWNDAPPLVTAQLRDLWELGLRPGDVVISPPGTFRNLMDYGYQALGAVVVTVNAWIGNMREVVEVSRRHRPAYINLLYPIVVELERMADTVDLREAFSSLKGAAFAGQPLGRRMSRMIREDWGIEVFEYTSAADTGTAWECREHNGFHLWEDTVFAECVDTESLAAVPDGQTGELVATDLDNRAAPLIRYRSSDLVRLSHERCGCGRTHGRMWIAGRRGDETIVRGRPVTLRDLENVVEAQEETGGAVFQVVRAQREVDELRVRVGYDPAVTGDLTDLAERLRKAVYDATGVEPVLELQTEEDLLQTVRSVAKFARVVSA